MKISHEELIDAVIGKECICDSPKRREDLIKDRRYIVLFKELGGRMILADGRWKGERFDFTHNLDASQTPVFRGVPRSPQIYGWFDPQSERLI